MNHIFKTNRILDRMNQMIDNAIDGKSLETHFDETKMSALETKLERYLEMTRTSREQLAEDKTKINELISDISHQTKTPLANILLYSQLLAESGLPDKEMQYVRLLAEQTDKLNFLITSLIKGSRLESGIIAVVPKLLPIAPLLRNIIKQSAAKAASKSITVSCQETGVSAYYDAKWTYEALCNIMDNAVKYTPSEGCITISVIPYQLFCRIDIADTGIGMPENEIPLIFSRFYRSPSVSNEEGIGIGLYLSREIISKEGGYIQVKSKPGKGSVFSVFLPMEN